MLVLTATVDRFGPGETGQSLLLACRLIAAGVRFVTVIVDGWDTHKNNFAEMRNRLLPEFDLGYSAMLDWLEGRGLLESTVVLTAGEFGRTPMAQGSGRDHHIKGYSMFMCGGGIKGGVSYGNTDEFGYHAVEDIVHIRDMHATMLHQLGIDHSRMTFKHQGLDAKLTGVEPAKILKELLV